MTTAIRTSGKHGALLIAGILMIATTLRHLYRRSPAARHHSS
jgi:hypothetical protein